MSAQGSALTPYDKSSRLQPHPWHVQPRNLEQDPAEANRYGKVDFDDDEGATQLTAHVERTPDATGHTVHLYVHGDEAPAVNMTVNDKEAVLIQPSAALQEKVRDTIAVLDTETQRIESEVYWQQGQALILVGGESGYRRQQAIIVYEPGSSGCGTMSAIVKNWAEGVRDTRIG